MIHPLTKKPWLTSLVLVALTLTVSAVAAVAEDGKEVKVRAIVIDDDDDETDTCRNMKIEVTKTDGKSHLKMWTVQDGKETLVEDRELEEGEDLDHGAYKVFDLDDDDLASMGGVEGHRFFKFSGDDDLAWVQKDGGPSWFPESGGWLGVQVRELGEQLGAYFGAKDGGALVESVVEDSPAAKAGFQAGDVIVMLDGVKIDDPEDVITTVQGKEKGDKIEVKVLRKGKETTLKAELAEREGGAAAVRAMGRTPRKLDMRKFMPGDGSHEDALRLYHEQARRAGPRDGEIENLHADIAELRAMIDELREKLAEQDK